MTKVVTIATALLALTLAACGGGSESYSEEPETAVATQAAAAPAATATPPAKTAKSRPDADVDGVPDAVTLKGKLGDTLTLEGAGLNADHQKSKIRVTLQGMKGPFQGFKVANDRKLIGVVLK